MHFFRIILFIYLYINTDYIIFCFHLKIMTHVCAVNWNIHTSIFILFIHNFHHSVTNNIDTISKKKKKKLFKLIQSNPMNKKIFLFIPVYILIYIYTFFLFSSAFTNLINHVNVLSFKVHQDRFTLIYFFHYFIYFHFIFFYLYFIIRFYFIYLARSLMQLVS